MSETSKVSVTFAEEGRTRQRYSNCRTRVNRYIISDVITVVAKARQSLVVEIRWTRKIRKYCYVAADMIEVASEYTGNLKLAKALSILAFIPILVALAVIIATPQASQYEPSLYAVFPWYLWALVIIAIMLGELALVISASSHRLDQSWVFGLIPILAADLVLLLIPFSRGYVIYGRADTLFHLGYMRDILNTGNFGADRYPVEHILGVAASFFSGLDITTVLYVFVVVFSFFFIGSFYLLATQLLTKREVIVAVSLFSVVLFSTWNVLFIPSSGSFFMLPFAIYLIIRSWQSKRYQEFITLAFFVVILIVLFHPLTTFILVGFLIFLEGLIKARQRSGPSRARFKTRSVAYLVIVACVCFFGWQAYLILVIRKTDTLVNALTGEGGPESSVGFYADLAARTQLTLNSFITEAIKLYGQFIILAALALFCIFFLRRTARKNHKHLSFSYLFSAGGFLVFLILTVVFAVLPVQVDFFRIIIVATLFALLLIPQFIYPVFFNSENTRKPHFRSIAKKILFCAIVFAIVSPSVFNLFFSPTIRQLNQQVTASELSGMKTFFENRNQNLNILQFGAQPYYFYVLFYGIKVPRLNVSLDPAKVTPPDHFGYDHNTSLSASTQTPTYLVVNDFGRDFNPYLYPEYPELWRFTPADFNRLNIDPGMDAIYANGNLNVYITRPT